jgi:hypothetical protein
MPIFLKAAMQSLADRFWAKVHKTDGCWLWTGYRLKCGYGRMHTSEGNETTHRVSYALHYGAVPEGAWVLHKCDVRACVNPDHLFAGTAHDNVHDCMEKGRRITMKGKHHGRSKLDEVSVRIIRTSPLSIRELADIFEVDKKVISNAQDGTTWKHVDTPPVANPLQQRRKKKQDGYL